MGIESISNGAGFNPITMAQAVSKKTDVNNNNSGLQPATKSDSGQMGGMDAGTTGGATQGGVQVSAASGSNSSSTGDIYYDKKDTNKDGIVSYLEELEYELKHPGEGAQSQIEKSSTNLQNAAQYNQKSLNISTDDVQRLINISV
jgi:hypothetical protein